MDSRIYAGISGLCILGAISSALTYQIVGGDAVFATGTIGALLTLAGTLAGRGNKDEEQADA